ncbi:hypothetical protein GLOTRDRAFT_79798 [Gloeophyllum trabeum ATCC 11539]|uniref:Uncharacterized protein n=1 Tax=Gloeophyllum trabeum (strain ATCC 11539 / FP-39264 / Madison 617) TaxID=670483 RepID=S7PYX9_GLOTA|nr:uncharacterized protein GLOTRDRAFT_79798 [Gloeophyllum trabeum ATCC 11539]EPQ52673.1 hypothetical protein GLOTRDRAFT_79798 [Gloeophyllum trabeum ATCC 11539]
MATSGSPQAPPPPMAKLPVELLRRVFVAGFNDDIDEYHIRKFGRARFEVLVSHVCHQWREVAISTAELWTCIRLAKVKDLAQAREYLRRAKKRLLDIVVDSAAAEEHVPGVTLSRGEFCDVFDIISPHVARWRTFILKVRDQTCKAWARTLTSSCGPAPALETLELYHIQKWRSEQTLASSISLLPVTIFDEFLPRLRNVSFIGVNLVWDRTPYLRRLKKLQFATHAEDVRPTYQVWTRILRASPELEKLRLNYSGPQSSGTWDAEPIPLPWLRELSLECMESGYLCRLLDHLSLPRLRHLHLELDEDEEDYNTFVNHISKPDAPAFGNLRSLHITALDCTAETWRRLLLSVPNLTGLEVNFRRVNDALFGELRGGEYDSDSDDARSTVTVYDLEPPPSPDEDIVLPRLQWFKSTGLDGAELWGFKEYRESIGHPIRHFVIAMDDRDVYTQKLEGCPHVRVSYFTEEDEEAVSYEIDASSDEDLDEQ